MRSGAKNTLKKRGVKAPETARRAAFATTGRVQREGRCSPELARRSAGQRGLKTAGFIVNSVVISVINSVIISVVNRH